MIRDSSRRNVPVARSLRWSLKKVRAMSARQLSLLAADHGGYKLSLLRGKLPRRPTTLWIETTNHCNLNCLMCDRDSLSRTREDMEWSLFERIAEEAGNMRIRRIKLNRFGEPLLHPEIHRMTERLKSRGAPWVFFASNGTLLDAAAREAVVSSGLDLIVVSIDGHTPETYARIRSGASLEEIRHNVEELVRLREKKGRKQPFVQINTVLMKDNEAEVSDIIRYWERRVDYVNVRAYSVTGKLGDRSVLAEAKPGEPPSPCYFTNNSMLALVSGEVTVCCADFNGVLAVGNIREQSLEDIWKGEPYQRVRSLMREGRFDELPSICTGCLATQESKMKQLNRRIHDMYRAARKGEPE